MKHISLVMVAVLLLGAGGGGTSARSASASIRAESPLDFRCYDVYWYDDEGNIVDSEYQCFDEVEVTGDVIYVDTSGWWGPPTYLWPEYPPVLPDPAPPAGEVFITEADITNNVVRVNLTGQGNLTLEAERASGGRFPLHDGPLGSGQHTFSFRANDLPPGQYRQVLAWWISNGTILHTRSVDFTVKGRWLQTKYATIYEHTCSGADRQAWILSGTSPWCGWLQTWFSGSFVPETWENGSGIAVHNGPIQLPWGPCMDNQAGNRFKQVDQIEGACNQAVSDNTLAQGSAQGTLPAHCGKWVFVVDMGMKKVTDRCPDCWNGGAEGHLDNYTTQVLANCSRGAISLGTYQTIFMPF